MGGPKESLNYQAIEMERLSEIQQSITDRLKNAHEAGYGDSLRQVVLSNVVAGEYDSGKDAINIYIDSKNEYPGFVDRTRRYRQHCMDLISAISAKRSFQGLGSLPLSKQQEIYEKVVEHFEELKHHLKSIERLEKEARLDDIRATTWFLKALVNCTFLLLSVAFVLDLKSGLAGSFLAVFDSLLSDATGAVFRLIGW